MLLSAAMFVSIRSAPWMVLEALAMNDQQQWFGRKVAAVGMGISNIAASKWLLAQGARMIGCDRQDRLQLHPEVAVLAAEGMELQLGETYLQGLENMDAVLLSPGIPKDIPEITALVGRVPIFGEVDLVLDIVAAPVIGVTGSSGKTTTASLIGAMLKASGVETVVGGNIGVPLISCAESIPATARVVLELSSFQLEWAKKSPAVGVWTNISENHLDIHKTMEAYISAKTGIFRSQGPGDVMIMNFDDPRVRSLAPQCPGHVYGFSRQHAVDLGAYVQDDVLMFRDDGLTAIGPTSDIRLRGAHNLENVLAAATAARLAGASWDGIRQSIRSFAGVPHRLEEVGTFVGVAFYNDSIATSPARSAAGVASFQEPLLLIAGGYDKKLSYETWAQTLAGRVKTLILMGEAAPILLTAVNTVYGGQPPFAIIKADKMAEAVAAAVENSVPGDAVLLSPACASFDMYANFERRGEDFRRQVFAYFDQGGGAVDEIDAALW